jgi:hypothetical protein
MALAPQELEELSRSWAALGVGTKTSSKASWK